MSSYKLVFAVKYFIVFIFSILLSLLVFFFLPYSYNVYASDTFSDAINSIALDLADDNSSDMLELEDIERMVDTENDSTYSSDSEEDVDDSNSLEQQISSKYDMGIDLNFGSQVVRERLGISFIKIRSEKIRYSLKLSYGSWDSIRIKYEDNDYDVVSKNYGTTINFFYYPKFFFPIYVSVSAGYYYWKGDIKPISLVANEEKENTVQDPNLTSNFHLHTIIVSSSFGWDFYFDNGWFIQHCLFGIGSVFTVGSSFSDNEVSDTKSSLKQKLARPYLFGPLNIGIGKLF